MHQFEDHLKFSFTLTLCLVRLDWLAASLEFGFAGYHIGFILDLATTGIDI